MHAREREGVTRWDLRLHDAWCVYLHGDQDKKTNKRQRQENEIEEEVL